MQKRVRVHNHPYLERTLQVPNGHVIIDEELYMEILQKYGNYIITDVREKSKVEQQMVKEIANDILKDDVE